MDALLLAVVRAAHGLTAAVWLGISLVAVLSPGGLATARAAGRLSLRALAQFAMWALVVTGALLMLDRLANPAVSTLYVALLAVKLAAVVGMGLLALVAPAPERGTTGAASLREELVTAVARGRLAAWRRSLTRAQRERLLLALGLAAYALGSLLTGAYETVLRGT